MWRIALILLCLFGAPAYSEPPSPTPRESSQKPKTDTAQPNDSSKTNQRGTEDAPFVIKLLTPHGHDPKTEGAPANQNQESSSNWGNSSEFGLFITTVILAVITFALAVFTAFLWFATKKLVTGAEDTAKRQLRAYVMIKHVKMVNVRPDPSIDFHEQWIHVKIKNFGQVPATKITYWFAIGTAENPLRNPLTGIKVPQYIGVIPPHDTYTALLKLGDDIQSPDEHSAIYIFGEVHYFDGFVPDRWTKMRFIRAGGKGWSRDGPLNICQQGNEAS